MTLADIHRHIRSRFPAEFDRDIILAAPDYHRYRLELRGVFDSRKEVPFHEIYQTAHSFALKWVDNATRPAYAMSPREAGSYVQSAANGAIGHYKTLSGEYTDQAITQLTAILRYDQPHFCEPEFKKKGIDGVTHWCAPSDVSIVLYPDAREDDFIDYCKSTYGAYYRDKFGNVYWTLPKEKQYTSTHLRHDKSAQFGSVKPQAACGFDYEFGSNGQRLDQSLEVVEYVAAREIDCFPCTNGGSKTGV